MAPVADQRRGRLSGYLFAGALLLTLAVYWPGFSGPFLFDDFATLPALGYFDGVRDWETFWLYFGAGITGPTGRPLALASFLLNATDWPADPWGFKLTNLLLHLLCGLVLAALLRQALPCSGLDRATADWAAVVTAGLWLLHPLQVSTVLYVVQRMTLLSALFVLLGLWGYCRGRWLMATAPARGAGLAAGSLVIGTLLATLSKENGILLPTLALVVETCLLRAPKSPLPPAPLWLRLLLWVPTGAILTYLLHLGLTSPYSGRPFTAAERLLTEGRILFDYLGHWFFPKVASPGLLVEDYPLSTGLFSPPSTLAAVAGVGGLLGVGLWVRPRVPWLSAAILFFLAGHLLESTSVPLELYFEHRNYLPTALLCLPPAVLGLRFVPTPAIRQGIAVLLALGLAGISFLRASLWASELDLYLSWADQHPYSARAQTSAALVLERVGRPEAALGVLETAMGRMPDHIPLRLHWLQLVCRFRPLEREEVAQTLELMRTVPHDFRAFELLESVLLYFGSGNCRGLSAADAQAMVDALFLNPSFGMGKGPERQLHHIRGQLYLIQDQPERALAAFRKSLEAMPDPEAALVQAALLASKGAYLEARELLDLAAGMKTDKSANLLHRRDYAGEITRLRRLVAEALAQGAGSPATPP